MQVLERLKTLADLNGDGKVSKEDIDDAAAWAKQQSADNKHIFWLSMFAAFAFGALTMAVLVGVFA